MAIIIGGTSRNNKWAGIFTINPNTIIHDHITEGNGVGILDTSQSLDFKDVIGAKASFEQAIGKLLQSAKP